MTSPTANGQGSKSRWVNEMPAAAKTVFRLSGTTKWISEFMGIPAVAGRLVELESCHGGVPALHISRARRRAARLAFASSFRTARCAHSRSLIRHLSGGLFEPLRREAQAEISHRMGGSVAAAQPAL